MPRRLPLMLPLRCIDAHRVTPPDPYPAQPRVYFRHRPIANPLPLDNLLSLYSKTGRTQLPRNQAISATPCCVEKVPHPSCGGPIRESAINRHLLTPSSAT